MTIRPTCPYFMFLWIASLCSLRLTRKALSTDSVSLHNFRASC